jgi:transposase
VLAELTTRYDRLAADGLKGQQPPGAPEQVNKQAHHLLLRMERRKDEVLLFLTDLAVPFDHNQAGRDLRMVKLDQKVSGRLQTQEGARQFCRHRSYLSTMRKQGRGGQG